MIKITIIRAALFTVSCAIFLNITPIVMAAEPSKATKKVFVAVPPDFPPTYYRDSQTGKPKGFAIDVMEEVAKRAGLEVEYVFGRPWDDLLDMLSTGKADLIPNLTINDVRKEKFNFTATVETVPVNLTVRADSNLNKLIPGIKVGCIKGSISHDVLKPRSDIQLITYDSLQHMLFDLLAGQLDMISTPTPNVMKMAIDAGVDAKLKVLYPSLRESKRAMAVRKNDVDLLNRLNSAIEGFVGSDKYKEIYSKWWGKPNPYWTTARVEMLAGAIFLITIIGMAIWRYYTISSLNSQLHRSEKKYRELFNGSSDAVFVREFSDSEGYGSLLEINDTACRLLGYSRGELSNLSVTDINVPSRIKTIEKAQDALVNIGKYVYESVHKTKDGTEIPVEINARKFELEGKTVVLSIVRDITERKASEKSLRDSEAHYRSLFDSSLIGVAVTDKNFRFIEVNDAFCGLLEYQKDELIYKLGISDVSYPDDTVKSIEMVKKLMNNEIDHYSIEKRYKSKSGKVIDAIIFVRSIHASDGQYNGSVATVLDLSELKRAEETLKKREETHHKIISSAMDGFILANPHAIILEVNESYCRMSGYSMEELLQLNLADLDVIEHEEDTIAHNKKIMEQGMDRFITQHRRKDGSIFDVEVSSMFIDVDGGMFVGFLRDVTESKKAEETLRRSEEKFSVIFKTSPDSININTLDDAVFVDVNEGFTSMLGYSRDEVIGVPSISMGVWVDAGDRARLARQLRETGSVKNLEAKLRRKDGAIITALVSSSLIEIHSIPCTLNIARDITERDSIQMEQLKLQKLESLGTLAGGIAHDFNNILTGIMGNISFAQMLHDPTHKAYKLLESAEKASLRAKELAQQLLTFAKGGEPLKKVVSIKSIIDESASFVLRGTNIKCILSIPENLHAVEADGGQLSQAFNNIIINATQAMPSGGTISITGQNIVLSDANPLLQSAGSYVKIDFTDQGCGISETDLNRIFDPYFTTKSAGSGLGLASVYSIINRHDGKITVSSEVGKGTTFTIYLPSTNKVSYESPLLLNSMEISVEAGGAILVMDDEQMIRELASEMLEYLGYQVATCSEGAEAVSLFYTAKEKGTPYRAVLMDLTVPGGMGGKEAAQMILENSPDACLIVSSGYSNDPIMSNYLEHGFKGAISKPYKAAEIKQLLSALHL